jgi:hypothetical protein
VVVTRLAPATVLFLWACGGTGEHPDGGVRHDASIVPFDGGTCTASVASVPITGYMHVPQGQPLTFNSNPPVGGDHYPEWLHWAQGYDVPVDPGNWVHNEEHGGVVLISRCEAGCDDVMTELERLGGALPQDPLCTPPINARWLVVRDPLLPGDISVAAAAWGWRWRAPCLDVASLSAFIGAHYGQGREDTCLDGQLP